MAYWLLKSEPHDWSWDDQVAKGIEPWDGVRNFQAAKNMRAMMLGDKCFFYHSGKERAIVGMVEIVRTAYPDPGDEMGKFVLVDVKAIGPVKNPVFLKDIKTNPALEGFALIRQSRLSVVPVSTAHWSILLEMSNG